MHHAIAKLTRSKRWRGTPIRTSIPSRMLVKSEPRWIIHTSSRSYTPTTRNIMTKKTSFSVICLCRGGQGCLLLRVNKSDYSWMSASRKALQRNENSNKTWNSFLKEKWELKGEAFNWSARTLQKPFLNQSPKCRSFLKATRARKNQQRRHHSLSQSIPMKTWKERMTPQTINKILIRLNKLSFLMAIQNRLRMTFSANSRIYQ